MFSDEEQKYRPVESITWFDACYFCNVLSEKVGLTKAYSIIITKVDDDGHIKEATEEFKYFYSGKTTSDLSVDTKNADLDSAGLCDMSGNVREWCYDWKGNLSTGVVDNPYGPSTSTGYRVQRGGGWDNSAMKCSVSAFAVMLNSNC